MRSVEAVVLEAFAAVEARDHERLARVSHPEVRFIWPPSLQPSEFTKENGEPVRSWEELWDPFQPTAELRLMTPHVVAVRSTEVIVAWRQRGVNADGHHLDAEVLGRYAVRDELLYRAQMFYFDAFEVRRFLESPKPGAASG
jgi:ketosteroid isomerase-like protein